MNDSRLEQIVGNLLRVGVSLAAAVVFVGGVWYLAAHGAGNPDYRHFHGVRESMPWTQGLPGPLLTIQIGLLLLVATPVARVALTLVVFAIQHDRVYVSVTLIVLAILMYSLVVS